MKNLAYSVLALCFALLIIQGCSKGVLSSLNGKLVASKSTLAANAVDSVLYVGASASDSIKWSVTPAGFNTLGLNKNLAIITFNKAGTYTVQATVNGGAPATTTITVTPATPITNPVPPVPADSVITQSGLVSLAGDQITLLPNYYKSKLGDTTYIYFTAETTKIYACGNSVINFTKSLDANNNFSLNFISVQQPAGSACQKAAGAIATGIIPFMQNSQNPYMTPGVYPLTVTLNSITYTGSIVITTTDITFNWNYTSGVMIAPKHFSR
ncbi:MAG: hypothetical protein JWQ06_744 [Mucilaginibacter sp.]|nr:hypothetical protein [Mucilaginibacter sp.]